MARKRMLDPSIWTDDGMAELTPRQQLLYIGLISNADDEGRLKGNPVAIRLMLPGIYGEVSSIDIASDLEAVLRHMQKLNRYYVSGKAYLHFRNYSTWQVIKKPMPSVLPSPDEADADKEFPTSTEPVRNQLPTGGEPVAPNRTEQNRKEQNRSGAPNKNSTPRNRSENSSNEKRPDQAMWDAFRDTLGTEPRTKSERGKWNGAIKELVDAEITPEEVPRLVKAYRRTYQDIDCNPRAIANNLSAVMTRNGSHAPPKQDRDKQRAEFLALLAEEEAKLEEG